MVLDFKVERLFVEKQVTFLFLPFSAARTDGTTSPSQRKKQTKTSHAILKNPNKRLASQVRTTHNAPSTKSSCFSSFPLPLSQ